MFQSKFPSGVKLARAALAEARAALAAFDAAPKVFADADGHGARARMLQRWDDREALASEVRRREQALDRLWAGGRVGETG